MLVAGRTLLRTRKVVPAILCLAIVGLVPTNLLADAESYVSRVPAAINAVQPRPLTPTDLYALENPPFGREVRLGPIDTEKYLAEDAAAPGVGPLRIGVPRDVRITADSGEWQQIEGAGWLWTISVVSEGATALRLRFSNVDMPEGAQLFVRDGSGVRQVEGDYADVPLDADGYLWTTEIFGDQALVEYFVPAQGSAEPPLPFVIDQVMHNYHWIFLDDAGGLREYSCYNDVTCYPEWNLEKQATAWITRPGLGCTGELIATETADETPYLITANHCFSTETHANSITCYWFYQTSTCNGTPPSLASVPRSQNGDLIATNSFDDGDQTLLLINGALPAGVGFVGWTTDVIGTFVQLAQIHHPDGAYKRITFCRSAVHPWGDNADFMGIYYACPEPNCGIIEGGSSGSGCYRRSDNKLVSICSHSIDPLTCTVNPTGPGGYGRFSSFYNNPTVSSALVAGSDDALEDNDTCGTAVTVTAGTYNNRVVKITDEDWYRVTVGPCQRLTATATFTSTWGNIDMQLQQPCGVVIDSSTGSGGSESVSVDHYGPAQDYFVRVYLGNDTRANYNLTISLTQFATPPSITNDPDSQTVDEGDPATFMVTATGTGPLSYQWRKDGEDLSDGGNISGATTDTLLIDPVGTDDAGDYDVVVTNCDSAVSDPATLTVQGGIVGDLDGDGDVDLTDFAIFAQCFAGSDNPPAGSCPPGVDADLDGDGDVDLTDFGIFGQNFTGSL